MHSAVRDFARGEMGGNLIQVGPSLIFILPKYHLTRDVAKVHMGRVGKTTIEYEYKYKSN